MDSMEHFNRMAEQAAKKAVRAVAGRAAEKAGNAAERAAEKVVEKKLAAMRYEMQAESNRCDKVCGAGRDRYRDASGYRQPRDVSRHRHSSRRKDRRSQRTRDPSSSPSDSSSDENDRVVGHPAGSSWAILQHSKRDQYRDASGYRHSRASMDPYRDAPDPRAWTSSRSTDHGDGKKEALRPRLGHRPSR